MAARAALAAASPLSRSSPSALASKLIPRRGLAGGGDHHGPARVNFWQDPLSPSKWKEEHYRPSVKGLLRQEQFVLVSLSGWGLLFYGGYKAFAGKKETKEEVAAEAKH